MQHIDDKERLAEYLKLYKSEVVVKIPSTSIYEHSLFINITIDKLLS